MFDIRTKNKKNKLNNICLNAEKLLENDNELDTHTIYMIIKALTNLEYNKEIYDTLSNEKNISRLSSSMIYFQLVIIYIKKMANQ